MVVFYLCFYSFPRFSLSPSIRHHLATFFSTAHNESICCASPGAHFLSRYVQSLPLPCNRFFFVICYSFFPRNQNQKTITAFLHFIPLTKPQIDSLSNVAHSDEIKFGSKTKKRKPLPSRSDCFFAPFLVLLVSAEPKPSRENPVRLRRE